MVVVPVTVVAAPKFTVKANALLAVGLTVKLPAILTAPVPKA